MGRVLETLLVFTNGDLPVSKESQRGSDYFNLHRIISDKYLLFFPA